MRLHSLEISNFRVIRQARLEFGDQVIGIIGPNGAGKSSIIEALAWSLYGYPAVRSGKDEIKSMLAGASDSCRVALEFATGSSTFRIVRQLVGKSGKPEVSLYRDGAVESVGSIQTEQYVRNLLGLDWKGFLSSFLARQQELNALSDLQPHKRRDHLAGMLGIEKLDRATEAARGDARLYSRDAVIIQKQLQQKESLGDQIDQLAEHVCRAKYQAEIDTGAYKKTKIEFCILEKQFREHQERKGMCSQLEAHLGAVGETTRHLREQLESQQIEEKRLISCGEELDNLEQVLTGFEDKKIKLADMKESERGFKARMEIERQVKSVQAEAAEMMKKLQSCDAALREIADFLQAIPDNVAEEQKSAMAELELARKEWAEAKADLKSNHTEVMRLESQVASIMNIGPDAVCDRCGRPFGDDLPAIQKHLDRELTELNVTGKQLEDRLTVCQEHGEKLSHRADKLHEQTSRCRELKIKSESLQREQSEFRDRDRVLAERLIELKNQLEALGPVSFDSEQLTRLEKEVAELEKLSLRAHEMKGRLSTLPAIRQAISETSARVSKAELERADFEQRIREVGFEEAVFVRVKDKYLSGQEKLDAAREARVKADKELEVLQREHELRFEQMAGLERISEDLEECRANQYYTEKLVSLLTDFRKYTISRIRPRLAVLTGELIDEMTDGMYSQVELDRDYNLRLMDGSQYFGVERFSGGEKDLANLCLRLAISLALSESAGLDRSFIILDEVFGSQDSDRRELILNALANLKRRFPQMLLITHIEELKHKVEKLIEVIPSVGGWSEVRIDCEKA